MDHFETVVEHERLDGERLDPHGYADRVYRLSYACKCRLGHPDCAAWDSGPCVDEVLTLHELDGGCVECRDDA